MSNKKQEKLLKAGVEGWNKLLIPATGNSKVNSTRNAFLEASSCQLENGERRVHTIQFNTSLKCSHLDLGLVFPSCC